MEYTQIAHKMVNCELEVRLPDFYRLDYAAGAEAIARVMVIKPESGFRSSFPSRSFLISSFHILRRSAKHCPQRTTRMKR